MRVPSRRFALPGCSGNSSIFKKERFILCLVSSSPSNNRDGPACTCSNMASCVGQDHRTLPLCSGRWRILPGGKLNLSPKMRSSVSNSSCFVDRANNQCAPRGIEACWCFWQERRGSGGKRSWGGPTFVEWENLEAHPFCCCS